MTVNVLERILSDYDTLPRQPAQQVPPLRRAAATQLREWGLPSNREENWRYANLRALEQLTSFHPAPVANTPRDLPEPVAGFGRLVFVNGQLDPSACDPPALALLHESEPAEALELARDQRLGLLNQMFAADTASLSVRAEASIEVLFISTIEAAGAAVYPRLNVQLTPGSRLSLIERHLGTGTATTLVCTHSSLRIGADARLVHYRLQQGAPGSTLLQSVSARLDQNAQYALRGITVGGASSRSSAVVQLAGRGAALQWHELAVGAHQQVHDNLLKVEHLAPLTRTEEVFRGIATERARISFNGHIRIDAAATDSDARQSLRGLVDGAGAEIDLRPRLEINTDAVRAVHGATTGRLDDNLMFYLLSRGLTPDTARALLKWAFLGDVLQHIDLPGLRHAAEQAAAGGLLDVIAAGALS